jgi:hypothetical protein
MMHHHHSSHNNSVVVFWQRFNRGTKPANLIT